MKKQILLPALLLLGFTTVITSCKKKKDDDVSPNPTNPVAQTCMVDRVLTSTDSTQLTYDSNNRLIKDQTFDNSGSKRYALYTYSPGKIVEQQYNQSGELFAQTDYHLNSNSHASYSVYTEGGDTENADTTWYMYDGSNHNTRRATKTTTTIPVVGTKVSTYDTTWYTYSGDNLTKIVNRNNAGDIETTIYSYGNADAKSKFLSPGQDSGIIGLFGNTSNKLPISETSGSTTITYEYAFNGDGYVTRYQETEGSSTDVSRFVYNCK